MHPAERRDRRLQDETSCQSLRGIVPGRGRPARSACFFRSVCCAGSNTMCPHIRAVNVKDAPVNAALLIERHMQTFMDAIDQSFAHPASVAAVDDLPLAVTFGHVAPFSAGV